MNRPNFQVPSTASLADELMGAPPAPPAPRAAIPPRPGPAASPVPATPRQAATSAALGPVRRARDSARDDPRSWEAFPAKLPAALVQRLNGQLAADQASTGEYNLAIGHYLEAAFSAIPSDVNRAAAWGFAWRKRADGAAQNVPVGSRLSHGTALAMHLLPARLRTLERRPKVWEIQAEALARLLDGLDET